MSTKISISVHLSNPINLEADYQLLKHTVQNVIEKALSKNK